MSATTEAVVIDRGVQQLSSYHFNHQIKCVTPVGNESVAVHYTAGSEYVTSVCAVTPQGHSQKKQVSSDKAVQHMIYVKKYRLYVMFCLDLTLRVFSASFQHIQTVHVTSTVLCMEFVESTSTLYTGQSGYVKTWQLRQQLHCPLVPKNDPIVSVTNDQWVVGLDYEVGTEKLTAATENAVFIVDTNTHVHQQSTSYTSEHTASITGVILFSSFGYLVLSFKDGSISVMNTVLHTVIQELSGHIRAVTALKRHTTGSVFLSCSLDGTVRVWSLETLTEFNRLDFGKEVLGMSVTCWGSDTAQLVCHSHHDLRIWQLSQLENHFTTVNSHTVALRRVESPGAVRIMATAEDGCVRLLSPATGDVITIFFPVFTSDVVSEVVYCPLGGLLFALLTTSEVLVLSAHTNPCSTIQLWTTRQRDRIDSICICVAVWKGKTYSLLFGGDSSGYIFLLHSSHVTMAQPCPAHGGRVCKLVSPDSPVVLPDITTSASTPCLLSLGSDNFLTAWGLRIGERGDVVWLKMQICVQMESAPRHIGILGSLLCVTTTKNSVKMLDISSDMKTAHQSCYLPHSCQFNSMPVLSHQREDRHTATITSLSSCPSLGLFATTSCDGYLKVWSTSNQLVSEIYFGDSLMSTCFTNTRGDLLVGFQRQICTVSASNYLPSSYLQHSGNCSTSDHGETPIAFDPTLKFWYDPERVPAYPMLLEERKKYCTLSDYYPTHEQPCEQQGVGSAQESNSESSVDGERKGPLSEVVDVQLTRRDSHLFLASVIRSTSSIADRSQLNKSGSAEDSLTSLRESILSGLGALRSQDLVNALVDKRRSIMPPPRTKRAIPVQKFPAEVAPLQSPSCNFPIAPDCLIPNSTIRDLIGYIPAPDPLILQQQKLTATIDRLLGTTSPLSPLQKVRRRKKRRSHKTPSSEDEDALTTSTDALGEEESSSETLGSESEVRVEERGDVSERSVDSAAMAVATSSSVHHLCYDDKSCGENSFSELKMSMPVAESTSSLHQTSDGSIPAAQSPSPESCLKRTSQCSVEGRELQISSSGVPVESKAVPALTRHTALPNVNPSPVVETKVVPTVTIPFQVGPTQATVAPTTTNTSTTGTTVHTGSLHRGTTSGADEGESGRREIELADGHGGNKAMEGQNTTCTVLQQMLDKGRVASNQGHTPMTAEAMCDGIVSILNSVDTADISTAIAELKQVSILTEAQGADVAQALVARLISASHTHTKQATLQALEGLGVDTDSVLLALLPSLVDSNMEVRNSAFSALKTIAGISTRSQLHQRLIQLGVLQHIESDEDKVLMDLSQRLENCHSLTRPSAARTTVMASGRDKQHTGSTGTPCGGGASSAGGATSDGCDIDDSSAGGTGKNNPSSIVASNDVQSISVATHKKSTTSKVVQRQTSGREESPKHFHIHRAALTQQTKCSGRSTTSSKSRGDSWKGSGHLDRPDLAIFRARLMGQPTLPSINCITARSGRRHNPTGGTHSVPVHTGLAEDSRGSSACDNKQAKKLRKLLATHPTLLSQSTHAKKLMERAYTAPIAHQVRGSTEKRVQEGDFKWTEVFPVLRETSADTVRARQRPTRAMTGSGEILLPKLTMSKGTQKTRGLQWQEAYTETCTPSTAKAPDKTNCSGSRPDEFHLKLPQIMH